MFPEINEKNNDNYGILDNKYKVLCQIGEGRYAKYV